MQYILNSLHYWNQTPLIFQKINCHCLTFTVHCIIDCMSLYMYRTFTATYTMQYNLLHPTLRYCCTWHWLAVNSTIPLWETCILWLYIVTAYFLSTLTIKSGIFHRSSPKSITKQRCATGLCVCYESVSHKFQSRWTFYNFCLINNF